MTTRCSVVLAALALWPALSSSAGAGASLPLELAALLAPSAEASAAARWCLDPAQCGALAGDLAAEAAVASRPHGAVVVMLDDHRVPTPGTALVASLVEHAPWLATRGYPLIVLHVLEVRGDDRMSAWGLCQA